MDFFTFRNGKLFAENVPVEDIATAIATPAYIYSQSTFIDHLNKIKKAYSKIDTTICFSVKACANINILKFMAEEGAGFDIVSGGELYRVLQAGADMKKIVFAGVGKTAQEIRDALEARIGYFNIESQAELEQLIRLAKEKGVPTKAALRVNPDVDPETHSYIATGKKETKFGVDIERAKHVFDTYSGNGAVDLCALHVHIGSGGNTIEPYVEAVEKSMRLVDDLSRSGHRIEAFDLGGGYGADYVSGHSPSPAEYADGIVPLFEGRSIKLILEPGKSIAANAGILLAKVLYIKTGGQKKFVIVDAGMNDLIRVPLYNGFHFLWPISVSDKHMPTARRETMELDGLETVDVVGPICESTDFFAKDRAIPPVSQGDIIAIFSAGAYGFTMASNYNARPFPPEVLVNDNAYRIIRRRQTVEDLVAPERMQPRS